MGAYDALLVDLRTDIATHDPEFAAALRRRGAPMPPARQQRPDEMRAQHDDDDEPRRFPVRGMPPAPTGSRDYGREIGALAKAVRTIPKMPTPTKQQQLDAARATVNETMAKALVAFQAGTITGHELQRLELIGTGAVEQLAARLR